jgi:hypothetical protein
MLGVCSEGARLTRSRMCGMKRVIILPTRSSFRRGRLSASPLRTRTTSRCLTATENHCTRLLWIRRHGRTLLLSLTTLRSTSFILSVLYSSSQLFPAILNLFGANPALRIAKSKSTTRSATQHSSRSWALPLPTSLAAASSRSGC